MTFTTMETMRDSFLLNQYDREYADSCDNWERTQEQKFQKIRLMDSACGEECFECGRLIEDEDGIVEPLNGYEGWTPLFYHTNCYPV